MGVHRLWDIVGPSARPVRLELLLRKKLAVDALIWIYQFLKAVRDAEGNALGQLHIVGFFRRICKLIYYGIMPVFVFDGGAPALKRDTINQRKKRREGQAETKRQVAQKLLAMQMHRMQQAGTTYYEDTPMQQSESSLLAKSLAPFRKQDDYHLPHLNEFTVSARDERVNVPNHAVEDFDFDIVDGVDINTIDPNLAEFAALSKETQYMVLSHLRLKSRLRMGYRKEDLEDLFPNLLDFSRFQIKQVQKRNFYTQKLMEAAGMDNDGTTGTRRVAGENDREYLLVKSDNGWTLTLGGENSESNPIQLDEYGNEIVEEKEDNVAQSTEQVAVKSEEGNTAQEPVAISDDEFEDVAGPHNEEDDAKNLEEINKLYGKLHSEEPEPTRATQPEYKPKLMDFAPMSNSEANEGNTNDNKLQQETKSEEESDVNNSDDDDWGGVQFGQSLLSAPVANDNDEFEEVSLDEEPQVAAVHIEETHDTNEKSPVKVNIEKPDLTIVAEGDSPVKEIPISVESSPKEKSAPVPKDVPNWFDSELKDDVYAQAEFAPTKADTVSRADDDGLMSWGHAQDILGNSDLEEELNLALDDDVQEINPDLALPPPPHEEPPDPTPKRAAIHLDDYEFEQDEEEELAKALQVEEDDHKEFKDAIRETYSASMAATTSRIKPEQLLREQKAKAQRDLDEVLLNMVLDVQDLLTRFGIPFITAPMEAEAQCAELLHLGLVDGIITDDSDCFLFGGSKVYKNMFNQTKYVEFYQQEEIDARLGLTRDKLIELAQLLGSDYTEGIKGIGPVLAMEILAEFGDLANFKRWYDNQLSLALTLKPSDKQSKLEKTLATRIKTGKLTLPDSFPSSIITQAYTHPEVDRDRTQFKWGIPNLDRIRTYLMYSVGWSQERVDEVMVPLIRDLNKRSAEGTQLTLGEFYPQEFLAGKELNMGKRLKDAAKKLHKKRKT